ncbi:hypothetical protein ACOMHN_002311 [Nucella lapillus]
MSDQGAWTKQDRERKMNTASYLLRRWTAHPVFRQCLSVNPYHLVERSSHLQHPAAVQYRPFSNSPTRLCHLGKQQLLRPVNGVTYSLNQPQNLQSSILSSKVVWQDQRRGIAADTKTTAVTIWEGLKQIRFSPVPALVLGFSGLIPFVAAPSFMIFNQAFLIQIVFAQTAYGACILSFLGGVRWGFIIPEGSECPGDWLNFGYSVTPSLVAWTALLLPQPVSILLVIAGFAGSAYFDTAVKGYPPWFKGLRFTLSFGAILSLWTAFLCQYMLSGPSDKQKTKEDESA